MPSRVSPSVISAAVMAAPLSLKPERVRPRFWKRLRQAMGDDLCRPRPDTTADDRQAASDHPARPNRIGVCHSPRAVSTFLEPW